MVDIFLLSELQEAEQGEGILLRGGGSAANTAAWLAWRGGKSAFVGCVGEDAAGPMLVQELDASGVLTRVRKAPGTETGAVLIRVEEDGTERIMRSSRGANMALSGEDIASAALPGLACLHITGYSLLSSGGLDLLQAASRVAKGQRAMLSFDPSSVGVINHIGAAPLLAAIRRCGVDILLPNAAEAAALAGGKAVNNAAQALTEYVPAVLVKTGANGAAFAAPSSAGTTPATRARPVDPTGAGDAFNAGALAALTSGKSIDEACREGVTLAGEVLTRYGGRPRR